MESPNRTRLLMVDDDVKLCRLIRDYLGPMGFDLDFVHSGPEGLSRAVEGRFDAMILDVMLPGIDGFELLRQLRARTRLPVVMLTGRGEEIDRIVGLEMGADDYLPKTASTRELLARIRAVLRRSAAPDVAPEAPAIAYKGITIDAEHRRARLHGAPIQLTPLEFDLLLALAQARGRVMSREQLLRAAANRELDVFDRSIDVHISSLRRKLGDDSRSPQYIQTVRSAGYRFGDGE